METYTRKCPSCGEEHIYSSVFTWRKACENNSCCRKCGKHRTDKAWKRLCPRCNEEIVYRSEAGYANACKINAMCRRCTSTNTGFLGRYASTANSGENNAFFGKSHTDATRKVFAEADKSYTKTDGFRNKMRSVVARGKNHHMYGSSHYKFWVNQYGEESAKRLEIERRKKISSKVAGSLNPMFGKPSPMGSGCGWSGWYKGWFFRSLRELAYVVKVLEANGDKWKTAETKDLCIQYKDFEGKTKNYFADFIVSDTHLVEIKPLKLHESFTVRRKQEAAEAFCEGRGFTYELVDPPRLCRSEVKMLHDTGEIRFTDKYEAMYQQGWA